MVRVDAATLGTLAHNRIGKVVHPGGRGARVQPPVLADTDGALLRVDDTVPGIAPEERARVRPYRAPRRP